MSGVWRRSQGRISEAPPNERGGNRYIRPTATAPHLDSTDLDAAVVEEAGETVPARERITDCLSELGLLADQGELGAQPGFQVINDRPAAVLADGAALIGIAAADRLGNR